MASPSKDEKKQPARRRRAPAPSRVRSTAVAERPRSAQAEEKGKAISDALYRAIKEELGSFDKTPNAAGNYMRLLVDGKGFGYVFLPREHSVMVRIPQHVVDAEPELRKLPGYKATTYGIWRTLTKASEVGEVAKTFKRAAEVVKAKAEARAAS